ncbi:MAG TPA: hypothetical protein VMK42_06390 [Anaeromyxobacteraceae bacterium]|nr:hypothetical protein [Anaeromyxobacteraceae bacterium]
MQGRLDGRPATVRIESRCATCFRPIEIEVDEEFRWRTSGEPPLVLEPSIDWARFKRPNILQDY